jgi:hypothetical protein
MRLWRAFHWRALETELRPASCKIFTTCSSLNRLLFMASLSSRRPPSQVFQPVRESPACHYLPFTPSVDETKAFLAEEMGKQGPHVEVAML